MAVLFFSSMGDYIQNLNLLGFSGSGYQFQSGRFGGTSHVVPDTGNYDITYTIGSNKSTIVFGGACLTYWSSNPFKVMDGGTIQVTLGIDSTGHPYLSGPGGTLCTASVVVGNLASAWCHLGAKVVFGNSGSVELYVNGVLAASASGVDTTATANNYCNAIRLSGACYHDDFWVDDANWLGDCRVQVIYPNGAGNSTGLTPSAGSNYQCVDETTPNDDTDYVSGTSGKDTYAFGNLTPTTGTVHGVRVHARARKDDAGTRQIHTVTRLAGTEVNGSDVALGASYSNIDEQQLTKPGGGAWSISDVNSAEFGVELV